MNDLSLVNLYVVLPIYNEQELISGVLDELILVLSHSALKSWKIVLSEDGSRDKTREILESYSRKDPAHINLLPSSPVRLGYSLAVIRGFSSVLENAIVCVMDSDGQCDPRDLFKVAQLAESGKNIGVGFRSPRLDSLSRRLYSKLFKLVHWLLFRVALRDPSCPLVAIHSRDLETLIRNKVHLQFGYWWEFQARAKASGLIPIEIAVNHRMRTDGSTRVYHFRKLPKIAISHLFGMLQLKRELSSQ
jgi:glycosyltransferase involved in cell wall biosynthesis